MPQTVSGSFQKSNVPCTCRGNGACILAGCAARTSCSRKRSANTRHSTPRSTGLADMHLPDQNSGAAEIGAALLVLAQTHSRFLGYAQGGAGIDTLKQRRHGGRARIRSSHPKSSKAIIPQAPRFLPCPRGLAEVVVCPLVGEAGPHTDPLFAPAVICITSSPIQRPLVSIRQRYSGCAS